jgi:hypothetical protein
MKPEVKIGIAIWFLLVPAFLISWYGWLGILGDFLAYCMVVTVVFYTAVIVHLDGPRKYKYKMADWLDATNQHHPSGYDESTWNVLLDTHFHTRHSDGLMTVEEGIAWHIAMGFNAFFVTDHDTLSNADDIRRLKDKYKDQILIMQGVEISTKRGDVAVLGLKEWDFSKF